MALFLGAKGTDILSLRPVDDLVEAIHDRLGRELSVLPPGSEVPLLEDLQARLEEERAFEEEFDARFTAALQAIEMEVGNLLPAREEIGLLIQDYFERRHSVVAFFELCGAMRKSLIRRALEQVEAWMEQHGFGTPPGRYCWFVLGCSGRGEGSLFCDCESVFVFHDEDDQGNPFFRVFGRKAEELLAPLGLHTRLTAAPARFGWQGSIAEWRSRLNEGMVGQHEGDELAILTGLADLSLVAGDETLAGEMLNLVRGMLEFHQGALRTLARNVSEMHTGLDFFGRLRLEKSGPNRGLFDLEQYALEPLVSNVRVLALKYGVTATGTIDRIKEVMERGPMTVELAERLLLGFHVLMSLKIRYEGAARGKAHLDPEQLSDREERLLKDSLDALVNLQRLVYQVFTEQG